MDVFSDLKFWNEKRIELYKNEKRVGFVPTMGALHDGHLSLVKRAKELCDTVVVSIYVNPTQFNDQNDLKAYPVDIERDMELLKKLDVDFLFTPTYQILYPDNYRYKVMENEFSKMLCGKNRPGHFDGVLTVVMKLFNIIRPTHAFFGEKDYQQLQLIKDMVSSFYMDIEIVSCLTMREKTGLAMSSRNERLSDESRLKAAEIFSKNLREGVSLGMIKESLESSGIKVDYLEEHFGRRFGAVIVDDVRLIDNVKIN